MATLPQTARETFLFIPAPETGHLLPLLPGARRLRAAGHTVLFFLTSELGTMLDREGFEWFGYVDDAPTAQESNVYAPEHAGRQAWQAAWSTREADTGVVDAFIARLRVCFGERAISLCLLDKVLSKKPAGLRKALQALFPTLIVTTAFLYADVDADLNEARTLALCPKFLLTPDILARFDRVTYCEPSIEIARGAIHSDLDAIPADKGLVLCTFGTQAAQNIALPGRLSLLLDLAVARPDLFFVVSYSGVLTAAHEQAVQRSANLVVRRAVPQIALLKRSVAFITHAGLGSVKEAIALGVPMLCWPLGGDQFCNASCVVHHGLGHSIEDSGMSVPAISRQLDLLRADTGIARRLKHFQGLFWDAESTPSFDTLLVEAASHTVKDDGERSSISADS